MSILFPFLSFFLFFYLCVFQLNLLHLCSWGGGGGGLVWGGGLGGGDCECSCHSTHSLTMLECFVAAGTVLVNTDCILAGFGACCDSGLVSGQISDWSSKSGLYLTCPLFVFCYFAACRNSSAYCKQTSCSWNLVHLFQHLFCVTVLHFGEGDSDYWCKQTSHHKEFYKTKSDNVLTVTEKKNLIMFLL